MIDCKNMQKDKERIFESFGTQNPEKISDKIQDELKKLTEKYETSVVWNMPTGEAMTSPWQDTGTTDMNGFQSFLARAKGRGIPMNSNEESMLTYNSSIGQKSTEQEISK